MARYACLTLILSVIAILSVQYATAATVTRQMPSTAEPGSEVHVAFRITDAKEGQIFTLEETRPLQFTITDWEIEGANESRNKIDTRQKDLGYGWSFTTTSTEATIRYTAKVSASATGPLRFEAVYFDPDGFNKVPGIITVGHKDTSSESESSTIKEKIDASKTEKSGTGDQSIKEPSTGGGGWKKILTGLSIILLITLIGLAIYFYIQRRRRRRDMFTHSFFFKK